MYDYAVIQGGCDNTAAQGGYKGAHNTAMAANCGRTCYSNQAYATPSTNYFTSDKLTYSYGQGSRLSLSYNFSGNQNRGVISDGRTAGSVSGSNVATLNWNQTLITSAGHQLTLDVSASRQWRNQMTSELTAGSESGTRISPGGFILNKLKFDVNPSDASAAGGGGSDQAALTSRHENRWVGIANLDFQADQYNRLKVRLGRQLPTR